SRSDRAALGSSEDRPTAKSSLQSGPKRSPIESGDTVRIKFSFPRNSLAPPTCDSPAPAGEGEKSASFVIQFSDSGRHCEPTGPHEARPDDRLREAIHFAAQREEWIASSLSLLAM